MMSAIFLGSSIIILSMQKTSLISLIFILIVPKKIIRIMQIQTMIRRGIGAAVMFEAQIIDEHFVLILSLRMVKS